MRNGAVPGVDFINTLPLSLLLFAKMFSALGLGWYELTAANIAAAWATFAALVGLTPRDRRSIATCIALAAAVAVPLVYTNHIWHSSLSQYAAAVFFLALWRSLERTDRARLLSLAVASAVLVLAKQNVALPVFVTALGFVILCGAERRWQLALAIGGGAAVGLALALVCLGMSLGTMVAIYTAVAGRGLPGSEMIEALTESATNRAATGLCLAALAIVVPTLLRSGRLTPAQRFSAVLFMGLAAIPFVTDWDTKLNNVTLPLIIVLVIATTGARGESDRAPFHACALTAGVLLLAVIGGMSRERMRDVGPGAYWEPVMSHRVEHGYFRGLHTGKTLAAVLDGMGRIRPAHVGRRLFFGPRLEFGYAVLQTSSPQGMPLWWHPGSSYAVHDEANVVGAFVANRFDTLIFLGDDRTRMPQALLNRIETNYRFIGIDGPLQIYERVR